MMMVTSTNEPTSWRTGRKAGSPTTATNVIIFLKRELLSLLLRKH
jgi:hypothetical protein